MNSIGIVAEYNPFHIGHQYQLQQIKHKYPKAICIIVMSGSFVQRGCPAFFTKFDRAQWALCGGADVVIELPAVFATSSASFFASAGVRLLAAIGVEGLCFGSETENLADLELLSHLTQSPKADEKIRQYLGKGFSYRQALCQTLKDMAPQFDLAEKPNALLGLEYIKALHRYHLPLTPILIQRQGAYHNQNLSEAFPSATAIRRALQKEGAALAASAQVLTYMPETIKTDILNTMRKGAYLDELRFYEAIHLQSRLHTSETLRHLNGMEEGLEFALHRAKENISWPIMRERLKSKRYSYARLDRLACAMLLGITKEFAAEAHERGPLYARLLGCTAQGALWLKHYQEDFPIIKKWAPFVKKSQGLTLQMAQLDMHATDLQAYCLAASSQRQGALDYYRSPIFIK